MTDTTPFLPSMPVMVRDFMSSASVAAMTNEQLGAFMRLLFCAWMSSPPCTLPDDDRQLATMAQMSLRRWQSVGLVVTQRFPVIGDGRRRNEKQWTQWQYAEAAARANQERGRKAAEVKAAKAAARRRGHVDRDDNSESTSRDRHVDREVDRDGLLENNSESTISNQQSKNRSQIRTGGVLSRTEDGADTEESPPALWRRLWEHRWPEGICRTSHAELTELERLVAQLGKAEIAARIGRYLARPDAELVRRMHPLGIFLHQVNEYREQTDPLTAATQAFVEGT